MLQTCSSRSSAVMLLYAVSPLYSLHPRPLPAASVRKNARTSNHSGCCSSAARTPPKAASSEVCHRAPRGTFAAGTQSIGKIRRDIVIRPATQPCLKGHGGNGPTVLVKAEAGLAEPAEPDSAESAGKQQPQKRGTRRTAPLPAWAMRSAHCPLRAASDKSVIHSTAQAAAAAAAAELECVRSRDADTRTRHAKRRKLND